MRTEVIIKLTIAVLNAILFDLADLIIRDKAHLLKMYINSIRQAASKIKIADCIMNAKGILSTRGFPSSHISLSGIKAEFRKVLA